MICNLCWKKTTKAKIIRDEKNSKLVSIHCNKCLKKQKEKNNDIN